MKKTTLIFGALCFLGVACQIQPRPVQAADAKSPSLRQKLDYLNQRMNKIEEDFSKMSRSFKNVERMNRQTKADLSVLIEDLRVEVRSLRGALDVLQHDLKQSTESNKKVQRDFDTRLSILENKVARPATKHQTGKERRTTDIDSITRYNQILRVVLDRKDYDTAIQQFRQFLKTYPNSSLAANAQYWMGEGYFAKENYRKAIAEFQKVVDKYPKSEKVCDAILKQGFSFAEMKDKGNAKLFLTEVTKRCPKTQAAARAKERLRELAG